jgi:hypothetical protein
MELVIVAFLVYPLDRRLGRPQRQALCGGEEKNFLYCYC